MSRIINFNGIISASPTIVKICETIQKVAKSEATILVTGESGTGKELVARAIHKLSQRSGEFVGINCAAIPEDILESELFGFTKGAFTGAFQNREGKFHSANGGTLFLDEIGEMSLRLQAKLLRVIQERTIQRLGSSTFETIDTRIIAATNKNLREEVEKGNFREDLLYRLEVVQIELPPLRQRIDDIEVLANYFFDRYKKKYNRDLVIKSSFIEALKLHEFRGNVRELQNIIERVVLLNETGTITYKDLPNYVLDKIKDRLAFDDLDSPPTKTSEEKKDQFNGINIFEFEKLDLNKFLNEIERE
ncbi:MAG: sigma-54 dependent transcriptional regulator, partial [Deltaproteobacteria bacterium]|nr:sigma-54 dependent transcriptional regulator [Deltaproteobacteria bacterium]